MHKTRKVGQCHTTKICVVFVHFVEKHVHLDLERRRMTLNNQALHENELHAY